MTSHHDKRIIATRTSFGVVLNLIITDLDIKVVLKRYYVPVD